MLNIRKCTNYYTISSWRTKDEKKSFNF